MNARRDLFAPGRATHDQTRARSRFACLWFGGWWLLVFCLPSPGLPYKEIVTPSGPITRVVVGEDGSLQIEHQDYPSAGQFYPSSVWPADCGFFLRHSNTVFGMDSARHDGTMAGGTQAAGFHTVSQTQSADGRLVSTVMDNSNDGTGVPFTVSQNVSYWPGDTWVFVNLVVKNESADPQTVDMFAAADLYLANSDAGYPYWSTNCAQTAIGGSNSNLSRSLFIQAAPGSLQATAYQEAYYADIWSLIGIGEHFQNTIQDTNVIPYPIDNGAGLEWQGVTIPAGGSVTVGYFWAFSLATCMELPIHVLWSGGTNMILRWDQPGYLLQASTNSLCNWHSLSVPITDTELTVDIDRNQRVFYRLARP